MNDHEPDAARAQLHRRAFLRIGALGATGAGLVSARGLAGPYLSSHGLLSPDGAFAATSGVLEDTCSTSRSSRSVR